MLKMNLQPIFKVRGIERPYTFLVKAGFTPHSAHTILNNKLLVFKLAHIERLCKILVCEPNDLLVWVPDNKVVYADNHPLFNLLEKDGTGSLRKTLATLPLKELIDVTKTIVNAPT